MIIQDLIMCSALECEKSKECYRKTTKPKEFMQKYHNFSKNCNSKCGFCSFLEKDKN